MKHLSQKDIDEGCKSKVIPISKAIEIINTQSKYFTDKYSKSDLMLISPNELSHLLFRIKSSIEDWEFY